MENEVVLLDFWPSLFGMRVRIALAEKSIQYSYKEENILDGKSPLLLQMNPINKKIPVLIHNGNAICESLIVVQYIDEVWGHETPLLPIAPHDRAVARFWADYVDKKLYHSGTRVCRSKGEDLEAAKNEFIESLKVLEGELGQKKFFGGDSFGFVDVALLPFYIWFYAYEKFGNFSIESECPKIVEWGKRCLERESLINVFPEQVKIYELMLTMRKKAGTEQRVYVVLRDFLFWEFNVFSYIVIYKV